MKKSSATIHMRSERGRDLLLLGRPSRLDTARQLLGRPFAPEMEEHDARLLVRHVRVDGNDVDVGRPERPQHRLQLALQHREVAVYHGGLRISRKRRPRVDTPISAPSSSPCAFVRFANTNFAIPSFAWALPPRMTSSGCASMVFSAGVAGPPKPSPVVGFLRASLMASKTFRSPPASLSVLPMPPTCMKRMR